MGESVSDTGIWRILSRLYGEQVEDVLLPIMAPIFTVNGGSQL